MSVWEVNDPTLAYVLCLNLIFWLVVGFASPERDEVAISESHCEAAIGRNRCNKQVLLS